MKFPPNTSKNNNKLKISISQNPFLVNISSISKGESSIDSSIDEFNIFKREIEQKEPIAYKNLFLNLNEFLF